MIFRIIGIVGLIFIILGTFLISEGKKVKREKVYPYLLLGGILLSAYSIYIKDSIFIILQISYTLIVVYNIIKLRGSKK